MYDLISECDDAHIDSGLSAKTLNFTSRTRRKAEIKSTSLKLGTSDFVLRYYLFLQKICTLMWQFIGWLSYLII